MTLIPEAARLTPDEITRRSRSSFLLSFKFLTKPRREALNAIYAFCRAVDDAADDAPTPKEADQELTFWEDELDAVVRGEPRTATGEALVGAVADYGVSVDNLREIARGCRMDVDQQRYRTAEELDVYCTRVASCVGLACLPVFGAKSAAADRYARALGLALQWTNITRDLRDDAHEGRVYAPLDWLDRRGIDPDWLRGEGPAEAYADGGPIHGLVDDLLAVALRRFDEAAELLPEEERSCLLAPEIMGAVYRALLDRVAARKGHLDRPERPRISKRGKLWIAARTWWRGRR